MLENFISTPICAWWTLIRITIFLEVSVLLDVRYYNKLQSCAISRKLMMQNGEKPNFGPNFGFLNVPLSFTSTSSSTLFQAIILSNLTKK